ncbi:MAG: hypothetical protein CL677_06055, partial [Bdellovibrionaceae bacterium]|nr:hypothetical protein [Pseudobdellovibrionaceae bacterium]
MRSFKQLIKFSILIGLVFVSLPGFSQNACLQLFTGKAADLRSIAQKVKFSEALDKQTFENIKILLETKPYDRSNPHYQTVIQFLFSTPSLPGKYRWDIYAHLAQKLPKESQWPFKFPNKETHPEQYLHSITGALAGLPIYTLIKSVPREGQLETIREALEKVSQEMPEILPKEWIEIAWDNVQKVETGFHLLQLMFKLRGRPENTLPYENSAQVLSAASGISLKELENIKDLSSERQLGHLYVYLLDITMARTRPPFKSTDIEPSIFEKKNLPIFIEALKNIRDYLHANGNTDAMLKNIFYEFLEKNNRQDFVFSKETVDNINTEIPPKLVQELTNAMEKQGLPVNKDEVNQFIKSWFDLDPLVTLFSRYSGKQEWTPIVPKLLEALHAMIKGSFKEYRYKGSNEKEDQDIVQQHMRLLTSEEARSKWRDGVTEVSLAEQVSPSQFDQNIETINRLRSIAIKMTKFNPVPSNNKVHLNSDDLKNIVYLITERDRDPRLVKTELSKLVPDAQLYNVILESLSRTRDAKTAYALVAFLRNTKDLFDVPEKAKRNLFWLRKISRVLHRGGNESIVLTTINADPRFMMALGAEPVDCGSCLSYKGGGFNAHGLLGWVIDPNVQGLAGYVLSKSHFSNQKDFEIVVEAIHSETAMVHFDGNMKQAVFTI